MRKITVNNKEYQLLRSFYRTDGSDNQIMVDSLYESDIPNLFYDRIFHFVYDTTTKTYYFIKEYLKDTYMAMDEFKVFKKFEHFPEIMRIHDVDGGKILCEAIVGISLIGAELPVEDVITLFNSIKMFLDSVIKENLITEIEFNANNTIVIDNKYFRIIDLETNESRREEFKYKNEIFYNFICGTLKNLGGL